MTAIRLVVQGDDLGMCRAVNEGISIAATDGILTQTSAMAPAPWFGEGAALACRLGIGVGLHVTFTAEWEYLRWGPLTPAMSLRGNDGTFHRTTEAAAANADATEAIAEATAQAARARAAGLHLTYVDPHMGVVVPAAYEAVCAAEGVKFMYPGVTPHHRWASITVLSTAPVDDRAGWFADRLDRLDEGVHFVMSHPGVGGDELRALTPQDAANADWTERFRVADLDALCDPGVRAIIDKRDIELIAVRDL
jgi:predicted glycoside hydrolase/deacetylase ChbG (UPF0249 family)